MDQSTPQGQAPESSGLAISSMILGIVAFPAFCCWPFTVLLAVGAIVCGHLGFRDLKRNPGKRGAGMAQAGLILGYVCLLLSLIIIGLALTGDPETQMDIRKMIEDMWKAQQEGGETPLEPVTDPEAIPEPTTTPGNN